MKHCHNAEHTHTKKKSIYFRFCLWIAFNWTLRDLKSDSVIKTTVILTELL